MLEPCHDRSEELYVWLRGSVLRPAGRDTLHAIAAGEDTSRRWIRYVLVAGAAKLVSLVTAWAEAAKVQYAYQREALLTGEYRGCYYIY